MTSFSQYQRYVICLFMLATALTTVIRAEDTPVQTKPVEQPTQDKTKDVAGAPGSSVASQIAPKGNTGISSDPAINTSSKSQGVEDQVKDRPASNQVSQSNQTDQLQGGQASSAKGSNASSQPSSGTAGSRQESAADPPAGKLVESTGQVNSPPKKDGDGGDSLDSNIQQPQQNNEHSSEIASDGLGEKTEDGNGKDAGDDKDDDDDAQVGQEPEKKGTAIDDDDEDGNDNAPAHHGEDDDEDDDDFKAERRSDVSSKSSNEASSSHQSSKPGLTSGRDKGTLSKTPGVKVTDDVQSSGHFMMYFVTAAVLVVLLYIVYHKRNLIFALLLEGRRSGSGRRRNVSSGSGSEYRQLSTAEEALPDDGSKSDIKGKSYMY